MQFTFDAWGARATDPDTSWEAALARLSGKAADRRRALEELGRWQGLTDFELGDYIHRQQTSAGKRRGELRDLGLVEDSGYRRAAPSGANAIVWRITRRGLDVLTELRKREAQA